MVALFEDIAEYSKEMLNLRNVRNKVSLEALLLFMQNKRDVFIAINFFPPNLSGASMSSLISACFYYSVRITLNDIRLTSYTYIGIFSAALQPVKKLLDHHKSFLFTFVIA